MAPPMASPILQGGALIAPPLVTRSIETIYRVYPFVLLIVAAYPALTRRAWSY